MHNINSFNDTEDSATSTHWTVQLAVNLVRTLPTQAVLKTDLG
jgi:hypothetical protein